MQKYIFLLIASLFTLGGMAQSYNTAAGPRLGTEIGLSVQQRISKKETIEFILNDVPRNNQVTISLLYEKHTALLFRQFNYYVGSGLHVGWINNRAEDDPKGPFGISFITGVELRLGRTIFSLDYKPALNLTGGYKRYQSEAAFSMRYIIIKKKKKKINWKFWENWGKKKK